MGCFFNSLYGGGGGGGGGVQALFFLARGLVL